MSIEGGPIRQPYGLPGVVAAASSRYSGLGLADRLAKQRDRFPRQRVGQDLRATPGAISSQASRDFASFQKSVSNSWTTDP